LNLFWGGLALAASLRLGAIALDPILATYRSSSEIRALSAEYQAARAKNERLHRQIAYLNSRAGIEEEARRLGWVRTGEFPLRIVPQPVNANPQGVPGAPAPPKPAQPMSNDQPQPAPALPRLLNPAQSLPATPSPAEPRPRTPLADRIQGAIAEWGVTKWLGEALKEGAAR
jgi:hypothetical protein